MLFLPCQTRTPILCKQHGYNNNCSQKHSDPRITEDQTLPRWQDLFINPFHHQYLHHNCHREVLKALSRSGGIARTLCLKQLQQTISSIGFWSQLACCHQYYPPFWAAWPITNKILVLLISLTPGNHNLLVNELSSPSSDNPLESQWLQQDLEGMRYTIGTQGRSGIRL